MMTMFSDSYQIDHIPLAGTSDRYQEQIPSDRLPKKTVTVQGGGRAGICLPQRNNSPMNGNIYLQL